MAPLDAVGGPSSPDPRGAPLDRVRRALDGDGIAEILMRDWVYLRNRGLDLERCEVLRLYPDRDGSFLLSYDMHVRGEGETHVVPVVAELSLQDAERRRRAIIDQLRKDRRRQIGRNTPRDHVAAIPALGMILRLPGLDEKIDALGILRRPALLGGHFGGSGAGAKPDVSLLGHRLGKRCVLRYWPDAADRQTAFIVKLYKNHSTRGAEVDRAMHALWDNGFDDRSAIRIPKPIAYIDALHAAVMEDMPGAPVARPDFTRAGQAIAKLHAAPLSVDGRHGPAGEIMLLEKWTALVATVLPDLEAPLRLALAAVRRDLAAATSTATCLVHRDFHEKQVIVDAASNALIDFDTLCMADPALDTGNFLAHLRFAGLQTGRDSLPDETAFADGYGPAMPENTDAYRRATLLRLACLYAFSSRWRHLSPILLQDL